MYRATKHVRWIMVLVTMIVSYPAFGDYWVRRGSIPAIGEARALAVYGDTVFVASGAEFLTLYDISDPDNPTVMETFNPPGNQYAAGIAFQWLRRFGNPDNWVWVADSLNNQIYRVRVTDLANPIIDLTFNLLSGYGDGKVDISPEDNARIVVPCGSSGMSYIRAWPLAEIGQCVAYTPPGRFIEACVSNHNGTFFWVGGNGRFRKIEPGACPEGPWSEAWGELTGLPNRLRDLHWRFDIPATVWVAAGDAGIYRIDRADSHYLYSLPPISTEGYAETLDWSALSGGCWVVGNRSSLAMIRNDALEHTISTLYDAVSDVEWRDNLVVAADSATLEIYQRASGNPPQPVEPENLVITTEGNDIRLSWQDDENFYYRIYSDNTLDGLFATFVGSTSETSFTIENGLTDERRFYLIKGSTLP